MPALADTSLRPDERALLDGFVAKLRSSLAEELHAVWLFGSRARGEEPVGEESDVDLLVLVQDASWDGKARVHAALSEAAKDLQLEGSEWSFSVHVRTPGWLAGRREIRSFFIGEVDRDKVVLHGVQ